MLYIALLAEAFVAACRYKSCLLETAQRRLDKQRRNGASSHQTDTGQGCAVAELGKCGAPLRRRQRLDPVCHGGDDSLDLWRMLLQRKVLFSSAIDGARVTERRPTAGLCSRGNHQVSKQSLSANADFNR